MRKKCSFCAINIETGMSSFSIPSEISDENLATWKKYAGIPPNKEFSKHRRVCATHFEENCIIRTATRPLLRYFAVPSIGVNIPGEIL